MGIETSIIGCSIGWRTPPIAALSNPPPFQHTFGTLRSVSERVVGKFLDCGNPMNGFALLLSLLKKLQGNFF